MSSTECVPGAVVPNGSSNGNGMMSPEELLQGKKVDKERLGAWQATGICGNDITSSCLYVSGIAIFYSGALAPVVLLLAAGVLYLYKKIYTEVVEALPLDGGVYNCLLNCTRKFSAAVAACLTLLSYLATAVISAKTAAEYLKTLLPMTPPMEVTAAILIVFAILTIMGISDSARVALVIFIMHLCVMTLFVVWAFLSPGLVNMWKINWNLLAGEPHWSKLIFFGFSAAMLGVSGFESSSNYVEQQKPHVFRLTLRNMWVAVTVFNPLIALLALGLMPVPEIGAHQDDLLSVLGLGVGGPALHAVVVVDAFLVLSGAVLTSYVGVSGLVHRMTLDHCFPQVLLRSTKRGSFPITVLSFMVLCISILYVTEGKLLSLAGLYTIAFLGVMTSFAVGNILLKVNRPELKRTYSAGWVTVIAGALATMAGIVGNLLMDIRFLGYFAAYFLPAMAGGLIMYFRIPILRGILIVIDKTLSRIAMMRDGVHNKMEEIKRVRAVVFVGLGTLPRMVKAFQYIDKNEDCRNILVFRLYNQEDPEADLHVHRNLGIIRELFPHLIIEFQARKGAFTPEVVEQLSAELQVPRNMMFMGSLTHTLSFSLQELGGVRVIW